MAQLRGRRFAYRRNPINGHAAGCGWGSLSLSQAAKKMAKAVLVALSTEPPKIHDLATLAALVFALEPEIGKAIAELGDLTNWYLSVRYADIETGVASSEVRAALENLNSLRGRIAALAPNA